MAISTTPVMRAIVAMGVVRMIWIVVITHVRKSKGKVEVLYCRCESGPICWAVVDESLYSVGPWWTINVDRGAARCAKVQCW